MGGSYVPFAPWRTGYEGRLIDMLQPRQNGFMMFYGGLNWGL